MQKTMKLFFVTLLILFAAVAANAQVSYRAEKDPTVDTSAEIQAIIGASVYEPAGITESDISDFGTYLTAEVDPTVDSSSEIAAILGANPVFSEDMTIGDGTATPCINMDGDAGTDGQHCYTVATDSHDFIGDIKAMNGDIFQANSAGDDKNITVYHNDSYGFVQTSSGDLYLYPTNASAKVSVADGYGFYGSTKSPMPKIGNFTTDTHPEASNFFQIPYVFNDIGFNNLRGGSVVIDPVGTGGATANLFDGTPGGMMSWSSPTGTITVEITFWKTYTYGINLGFSMTDGFRAKDFTVSVWSVTAGDWVVIDSQNDYPSGMYSHNYSSDGAGITKMKVDFSDFPYASFRLCEVFLNYYASTLADGYFLLKGGGTLLGTLYGPSLVLNDGSTNGLTALRVEGDTDEYLINTVGSTNKVGISDSGPDFTLTVGTGDTFGIGAVQWSSGDNIDATKVANADLGEIGVSSGVWSIEDTLTVTGWNLGASVATTPAEDDNDTSLATTAYVQTEIAALGGGHDAVTLSAFADEFLSLSTQELTLQLTDPGADRLIMWDDDPGDFVWLDPATLGGSLADGDKGGVIVSSSGTVWEIDDTQTVSGWTVQNATIGNYAMPAAVGTAGQGLTSNGTNVVFTDLNIEDFHKFQRPVNMLTLSTTSPPVYDYAATAGAPYPRAKFADGVDNAHYMTFTMPSEYDPDADWYVYVSGVSDEDVNENVVMASAVQCVSPGDVYSTSNFDTAQTVTLNMDQTAAGVKINGTITITNKDSCTTGDEVTISTYRDGDNGADDHTNEFYTTGSYSYAIPR